MANDPEEGNSLRQDSIVMGALAGLVGNLAKEVIVWPMYFLGWLHYPFVYLAASYFVDRSSIHNPLSLAKGFITDYAIAAILGVVLLYLLRYTGKDYALIKGLLLGLFVHIGIYGLLMAFHATRISILTPLPNLLLVVPHVVFGTATAWVLKRYWNPQRV